MLKWNSKSEVTDADVQASADAVIVFDMKQSSYMLKLSAKARKAGTYDYKQSTSL